MTNKNENLEKRIVPTGDKGVVGERDDMFHPTVSGKRVQFEHVQRYIFALRHIKSNKKVLDLGCGTGFLKKRLITRSNIIPAPIILSVRLANYHLKMNFSMP